MKEMRISRRVLAGNPKREVSLCTPRKEYVVGVILKLIMANNFLTI